MSVDPTASGPGVPYARGDIIGSSADDLTKLAEAWRHVRSRWAQGGGDDVPMEPWLSTGSFHRSGAKSALKQQD